uniref:Uncharacterized protein n=1 Tax=Oryza meridionalis TaxID=40149 RepID=A0A0E0ELB1_9ORYZ
MATAARVAVGLGVVMHVTLEAGSRVLTVVLDEVGEAWSSTTAFGTARRRRSFSMNGVGLTHYEKCHACMSLVLKRS